jgi:hypothetical protein
MRHQAFQPLLDNDVVSLIHDKQALFNSRNFKVKDFYQELGNRLNIQQNREFAVSLLKANKNSPGWIEGHMSFCLVFWPEQLTSEAMNTSYPLLSQDLLKTERAVGNLWSPGCELVEDLKDRLRTLLRIQDTSLSKYFWLDRGIECNVLQSTGQTVGWQPSLVRLQIHFVPQATAADSANDIIESSALESLRQSI